MSTPTAAETFPETERLVFSYWNGERNVSADPLALQRGLTRIDGLDLEEESKLLFVPDPKAQGEAWDKLVDAVRRVFGVKPLADDGTGLTEHETMALFWAFGAWVGGVRERFFV